MQTLLLLIFTLITPRSFALFESPFSSILSKNTVFLYPSLVPGYVSEFYINPYKGEGYLLLSTNIKKYMAGGMLYSVDSSLISSLGLRKAANSLGFTVDYSKVNSDVNAAAVSFSHRTQMWGYDVGFLMDRRSTYTLYSAYLRSFMNVSDEVDIIGGLRATSGEERALSGFAGMLFSPVSGQYIELTTGYTPWLRTFYISSGVSHQFYKNFALSMGFYYPLYTLTDAPSVTLSRLEIPDVLPSVPDYRLSFEFMDNSSIYTVGIGLDYSVLKALLKEGRLKSTPYTLNLGFSIYFYSF